MINDLKHQAYQYIREKLLAGGLAAGARLSPDALAAEIGISQTPVREAIGLLESEGLVDRVHGVGVFVRVPERHEIEELYDLRTVLESGAAALAAERAAEEDIAGLSMHCEALRGVAMELRRSKDKDFKEDVAARMVAADAMFHRMLIESVGNRPLAKMVADQHLLVRVWSVRRQTRARSPLHHVALAYREHARVLRALRRRDPEAARRAMMLHMATAKAEALRRFDEAAAAGSVGSGWPASVRRLTDRFDPAPPRPAGEA